MRMGILSTLFKGGSKVVDNVSGKVIKTVGKAGQPAAIMPKTTRTASVGGTATFSPASVSKAPLIAPPTGSAYKIAPSGWAVKTAKNTAILAGGTGLGIASLGALGGWGVQKVRDVTVDADQARADRDVARQQDVLDINEGYLNLWKDAAANGGAYALPPSTFPNQGVIFPGGRSADGETVASGGVSPLALVAVAGLGTGAYFLLRKKKGKRK